jgi:pyruvate/2-oxoacid:ferredoxin oxidoreductase alpha subunit
MSELVRAGLLRRDPDGDLRRAARRSLDRHADAHPAGRSPAHRLRLARRHTPHLLYPADPGECFTLAVAAFDLAERFQTPVFVLSDLDVGMNDWMVRRFEWDDAYRPNRGKVLTAEQIAALPAFHRYVDADGDGIAARTLPGVHEKGGYFARGSGHNRLGAYTEESHELRRGRRPHRAQDRRRRLGAAQPGGAPGARADAGGHHHRR